MVPEPFDNMQALFDMILAREITYFLFDLVFEKPEILFIQAGNRPVHLVVDGDRDQHELRIHASNLEWEFIPLEAARRLRASFVLLGPMLGRRGKVIIPNPGGDRIGRRPVNVHVEALRALGAEIEYKWGYYYARAPGGLRRRPQSELPHGSGGAGGADRLRLPRSAVQCEDQWARQCRGCA